MTAVVMYKMTGWMDGWLGFNGILSTQVAAISCLKKFKLRPMACTKQITVVFRMNVMEEIFEIRSCTEILANDIKVNTADERIARYTYWRIFIL